MRFDKMVMASFLALSLVACGGDEDKSRPDDDKIRSPEKSEDCIAAGDKCKLIDGQWIIEEEKPAPVIDGEFNYSDMGVTDELLPERKGFGFYHRGDKSPLDAKRFPKTRPTLSPIVAWSSAKEYDTDLYNYVAITPHAEKSGKGALKYMFDEIGIKNGELNENVHALGGNIFDIGGYWGKAGNSSYGRVLHRYYWHSVPALVNTLMWKDGDGNTVRAYADVKNKIWWNDEASVKGADLNGGGSGKQSVRIYGVNSFLQDYGETLLPNGEFNKSPNKQKYKLKNRPNDGPYLRHANFVYWKPSDRKGVAYVDESTWYYAVEVYRDTNPNPKAFPTETKVGELKYVQFGRITGSGVSPDAPKMSGYDDPALRLYPFASEKNVLTGNRLAEDWYFARGTEGTPIEKLDQLKSEGGKIVYDGMAVMFGLDYEPYKTKSANDSKKDSESGKSTNSVMPDLTEPDPEGVVTRRTPVDGKQNLLRLVWTPDNGHVNGAVFGVWTVVDYWAATKATTKWKVGDIVGYRKSGDKLMPDTNTATIGYPQSFDPGNGAGGFSRLSGLLFKSLRVDVLKNTLVELKGSRIEGTNSFSGVAIRTKDGDKGIFAGGFFGPDASEVGGVINSQTGSMNNPELTDPAYKWGGAFGAQSLPDAEETLEYLDFPDDPHFDYDSSNEVF